MWSSQMLWPASWSRSVAFMFTSWKVMPQQVADPFDRDVRRRIGRNVRGVRVATLAHEDGRQPLAPRALHRGQDAELVVDQHVALRRIASLDVVQLLLLVDVDEHATADGVEEPRALDLERLEDHVPVGEDHRRSPGCEVLDHV